jgi:hypothetical protein
MGQPQNRDNHQAARLIAEPSNLRGIHPPHPRPARRSSKREGGQSVVSPLQLRILSQAGKKTKGSSVDREQVTVSLSPSSFPSV